MSKAMNKAVFSLALLAAFGILIAYLSIANPPMKEFVGTIAGGIVSIGALLFAAQSRDEAKKAEEVAREGRDQAHEAKRAGERAEQFAAEGATEARAGRQKAESAEKLALATPREKRKVRKGVKAAEKAATLR